MVLEAQIDVMKKRLEKKPRDRNDRGLDKGRAERGRGRNGQDSEIKSRKYEKSDDLKEVRMDGRGKKIYFFERRGQNSRV